MSRLALAREIVLRMVGYGVRYGVLSGMAFTLGVFLVIVLPELVTSRMSDSMLLKLGALLLLGTLCSAVVGFISGLLLGLIVGVEMSLIAIAMLPDKHTERSYRKIVTIAMFGTFIVIAGILVGDTSRGINIAKFGLFLFPVLIAVIACHRAARKVSNYAAKQLNLGPEFPAPVAMSPTNPSVLE